MDQHTFHANGRPFHRRRPSLLGSALALAVAATFGTLPALATPGTLQPVANETAASDPAHLTTGPAVARDADGDIVVAWPNHATDEVYFRRYGANPSLDFGGGVKTALTGVDLDVASDAQGNFVIVSLDDDDVIRGQLFSASGTAVAGAFFIGNAPEGNSDRDNVAVAMEPDGDFVVAWHREIAQAPSVKEVLVRRYHADGSPRGSTNVVLRYTGGHDVDVDVATDAAGNFNVVWGIHDIRMQRFDAAGAPVGAEIDVAPDTTSLADQPSIAMTPDGRSVIAWRSQRTGTATRIIGRRYTSQAVPSATQQLNRETVGNREAPAVAIDADGSYAVVYTNVNDTTGPDDDDQGHDIRIARYLATGTFVREIRASAGALRDQKDPAVAVDADGDVVAAWSDHGDLHRIMVRRFSGQENTDLSLTISDAPDPVPVGGALEYTLITTNHHAPEAPTSITPIDTAIGTSTRQRLAITLGSGQKYVSATGADWLCAASGNTAVNCASTRTQAPTTTRSLVLKLTAPTSFPVATPATTGISAKVVGEQPDSNETGDFVNNFDAESTRLCAKDTLALDAAHYYLLEGGSLTVRVKRTGAGCGSASVQFTTVAGTAVPRGDYVHVSRLLTWADGDTADKTVTIQSVNDTVPEGTQYFTVQLQKPNAFAVLGTAQATVEMPIDSD